MYKVVWKDTAEKSLAKLDKKVAKKIFDKVEKYLAKDPYHRRKPLTGQYKVSLSV